jgi:hypothetical protein
MEYGLKNVSPTQTRQYIEKADHFLHGMNLLNDDVPNYRTGIGLLAIHSAISLNDAITVGLTGEWGTYQDHAQAARELEGFCSSNKISNKKGISHLKWLLAQKNMVAYLGDRIDDASVKLAVDRAQRFSAWAYICFEEVLRAQVNA